MGFGLCDGEEYNARTKKDAGSTEEKIEWSIECSYGGLLRHV